MEEHERTPAAMEGDLKKFDETYRFQSSMPKYLMKSRMCREARHTMFRGQQTNVVKTTDHGCRSICAMMDSHKHASNPKSAGNWCLEFCAHQVWIFLELLQLPARRGSSYPLS